MGEHAQQKSKNLKVLLANGSHPGLPAANNRSLRGTHTGPSGKKVQPFSTEHAQQKSKNLKVLLANGSHPGLPTANNRSLRGTHTGPSGKQVQPFMERTHR